MPVGHQVDPKLIKRLTRFFGEPQFASICTWNDKPAVIVVSDSNVAVARAGLAGEMADARLEHATISGTSVIPEEVRLKHYDRWLATVTFDSVEATDTFREVFLRCGGTVAAAETAVTQMSPVLVVTSNDLPGHVITDIFGDVFGITVRARNVFSNLGASLRTVSGGEVGGYTKLLTEARLEARARMVDEARKVGANAVIAMRFDSSEIGDIMNEMICYGTAVTAHRADAGASPAAEAALSPT